MSTLVIPYSSRWRSTVKARLIEYTTERNELESDSSSTTTMEVRRTQNGGVADTKRWRGGAHAALAAHHDVDALLG